MNKGQDLYKKAKKIIPGGTMLLSKKPEMFLPENWPAYYSKSKGCYVWDLDGNKLIDMSIMGIGTNTLGYSNDEVDSAVMDVIRKGNMTTLNCPEEVYLAEKLLEINDWADSVRFCRAGGEANALAIRIARASTGKDKVAICGYHGWHDWYISVNHNDSSGLDDHLLPGLEPKGIPKNLKNTVFPFNYNDYEQLEKICDENEIGVIKMEVVRNFGPENNFLQKVRELATKRGIVLIFDECTSGFRETFGGIHKKYSVNPDMAMFGKTIGNGYALTAVVGIKEVMSSVEDTFISSTFWTERIGPTAALKTLEVMENLKSWELITDIGLKIREGWSTLFKKYKINFFISGIPSLSSYSFEHNDLEIQTYITQEMLKKGFLASNRFYACISHNKEIQNLYFTALEEVIHSLSMMQIDKNEITDNLDGPIRQSGFKRLN
tara:strand:- start:2227 stop:3531 length:1305 start_codon:yes stop_codon:yes gene_type:complete